MRRYFLKLTILVLVSLVSSNLLIAQTDPLEKMKQDVLSGRKSIDQAKKEAAGMGLSGNSKDDSSFSQAKMSDTDRTPKRSLFLNPSYLEFSTKQAVDSVELMNISQELVYWSIVNKSKGISLLKEGKNISNLNGKLKAGEKVFVSFKMDLGKEKNISDEGLSYELTFKSSLGDTLSSTVAYIPVIKKTEASYFGYDIFNANYKVNISDIGPSSNEYIIAAGDELTLNTWGQVEMTDQLTVAANGTIFIRNVGQIVVAGEKLSDVKTKLTNIMSRSYSSLKSTDSNQAKTFLDISLQKISSFPVYVVGSVKKPGMVRVNSLSTVFSALFASGGVKEEGSLRNVEVVRGGKVIATVDLYEYLCEGNLKSDIRLSAKDVIRVPYRKSTVQIKGELNRPMIYELKNNENLADLVRYAGGLKSTTDASIVVIDRLDPKAENNRLRTTIKEKLGRKDKDANIVVNPIKIYDTDIIQVYSLEGKSLDYAVVNGAVYRDGVYAITKDMTVSHLIKEAGGLKDDAYKNKAELVRSFDDGTRTYYSLDLRDSLSLQTKMASRDSLKIYSLLSLKEKQYVVSGGHLPAPGTFLFASDMTVYDLVMKSGGLEDDFYRKNTYLERADIIRYNEDGVSTRVIPIRLNEILNGDEKANIKLEAGDKLIVYNISMTYHPKLVSIEGSVNKTGEYELQTNMTVKDIIVQAGGFLHSAYVSSVEVFRVDPFEINSRSLSTVKKIELESGLLSSFDINTEFKLQDRDIVVVRQYPKFQYHRKVELFGEVKYPGTYTLIKEKETLKELIIRAGGLTEEAYFAATRYTRNSLQLVDTLEMDKKSQLFSYEKRRLVADFDKVQKGRYNIELQEGDVIRIPKHSGIVTIEGFVHSPGIIQYREGWTAKQYIEAAGNYTFEADKGKTMLYYPGGTAKRKSFLCGFSKVQEGCLIKVPMKEKKDANFWLDFTAKVTSVIASVVTTIYLVAR